MNKNALKIFAVDSRKELIEKIQIKAMQYGIEKDKIKKSQTVSSDSVVINEKPLSKEEKLQREKFIEKVKTINESGGDGYKQVVEEVAYTWFNRFTALRFMEVNNYMPTRVRALSSETPGNVEPDLVKEANNVDLPVDKQKIYDMKLNNDMEGLFKYLIIVQCNALNKSLPFMFEKIGHYTELLFPDGLLNENAFIRRLTDTEIIAENDWEDVEIIGWLYQYYNSDEKDRVIQAKKKYTKEEIPFATQLFTPDWIVRYMVQNSVGRYWIESHPEHSDLKKNWEFYFGNSNPEQGFEEKLVPYINKELRVEDIKCFDPAMGSGHILVYMFDILYEIYEKCGYMSREIPQLIIENNLYGLDIDDRAYQLACFAVIMKGMKYNNRLLRSIEKEAEKTGTAGIRLNLVSIQETNNLNDDDIDYIAGESSKENYIKIRDFIALFKNAKIFGSLVKIENFDEELLCEKLQYIISNPVENLSQISSRNKIIELLPNLLKQAKIMINSYDILITNPPYMGNKYMDRELAKFIEKYYYDNKTDLFSAFMEYCMKKVKYNGQLAFVTPYVWMFIGSYKELRKMIVNNKTISSLIQLEYNAFEAACVPVCTFTMKNNKTDNYGEYVDLSEFRGSESQPIKVLEAINCNDVKYRYSKKMSRFSILPDNIIAYIGNDEILNLFKHDKIGDFFPVKEGINTGNNDIFLKIWYEVDRNKIGFGFTDRDNVEKSICKWFPHNKGGSYRKWYGNNKYLVDWKQDGFRIRNYKDEKGKLKSRPQNLDYFFRKGITFSSVSSSDFNCRMFDVGFTFNSTGRSLFPSDDLLYFVTGYLNSKLATILFKMVAPTLSFTVGNVASIPFKLPERNNIKDEVDKIVIKNIDLCKLEWDSYETSWDFKRHPLLIHKLNSKTIEEVVDKFSEFSNNQFYELKENEEKLNEYFIKMYGLENHITPDIDEKDISLRKTNREDTVKSFISYGVGCMLGRYSLDQEGILYAGGEFNSSKYTKFRVDEDNVVPVLSEGYIEDDIVSKFVEFVKVTFGEETLSENIEYIAEILGKKGNETTKETIRRYFLIDFYKDHIQTYNKRPIYWMFTSGKQKAFNCLIYMHRYDKTTLSRIRTDYLHELQDRLDTERKGLVDITEGDYATKEKSEAKKKLTSLDKQIDELKKYDEVLHHMADMQIEIDLDDGVVTNYEKFKSLLAKI